jgi:dethiobiotin synthetase
VSTTRGLFVTGTDTGVGKTITSAALLAAMRAAGEPVLAYKPAVTGTEEPPGAWPPDDQLLARVSDDDPRAVTSATFGPPLSPHLAARLAGQPLDPAALIARARERAATGTLVAEGVGGLLVPLTDSFTIRDLAAALALPVVIVARTALGTINHTLLTIEAARHAGLTVAAVVLNEWPADPGVLELSNRETLAALGEVEVATLARVADIDGLAAAGESLPWRRWLAQPTSAAAHIA